MVSIIAKIRQTVFCPVKDVMSIAKRETGVAPARNESIKFFVSFICLSFRFVFLIDIIIIA